MLREKKILELKVTFVSVGCKPEVWKIRLEEGTSVRYLKTLFNNNRRNIARRGGGSSYWVEKYCVDDKDDTPKFGSEEDKFFFKNMLIGDVYYKKIFQWIFSAAEIKPDMVKDDDVYIFETLHNAVKSDEERFRKILRKQSIAVMPFCEYRFLTLIPKTYPDGRVTQMRSKFIDYPIAGRFYNYNSTGKEIYETALSILRFYMVENAREILLQNSDGVLDLDEPKTLFQSPNRRLVNHFRMENRELIAWAKIKEGDFPEIGELEDYDEEVTGPENPFLRIECFAEEDMYKPIERNDRMDIWYHPEHVIDISDLGSLSEGKNLYQHDQDKVEPGTKQYLHVKFNVRFNQMLILGLFDEKKLGDNSFEKKKKYVDLQSYHFDPDFEFRLEELMAMDFEERDQLFLLRVGRGGGGNDNNLIHQQQEIRTFKWLFLS